MKADELEVIVGYIGRPYADLLADKIIPDLELREIYTDSDRMYLEPEEGLKVVISADEKLFIEFFITLKAMPPALVLYRGELPEIFFQGMDQQVVIDLFGEPVASHGPVLMPVPIGQTGGWASYVYDDELFPGIEVEFQYTADMQVKTLVFALKK
ncbi:DUF6392 family protein [Pseudomonas sp. zfem002]|uniref:DUF6392 family protein n=1 Tax=Pseudomonas sp. zfem002 TaxID=3078197 RepID=UPI0029277098|nr:DUF6392 family protein [Pseudomonas sp. zfem002]MDU9392709.1 DUF6392 family protein [Pseudomonas sp. zfem002]